jgi:hypothetical protein
MTVGSRRSGLNQNMALKGQYERALQDLADLVDTAQDKMAADQRIIASSVEEVQILLDKHKVDFNLTYKSHRITAILDSTKNYMHSKYIVKRQFKSISLNDDLKSATREDMSLVHHIGYPHRVLFRRP